MGIVGAHAIENRLYFCLSWLKEVQFSFLFALLGFVEKDRGWQEWDHLGCIAFSGAGTRSDQVDVAMGNPTLGCSVAYAGHFSVSWSVPRELPSLAYIFSSMWCYNSTL